MVVEVVTWSFEFDTIVLSCIFPVGVVVLKSAGWLVGGMVVVCRSDSVVCWPSAIVVP